MDRMKRNETVENIIKNYGKEAFQNHREDVYAAIKVICLCAEFLQNREDWRGRRAIGMRKNCAQDYWKEYCLKAYDRGIRGEELRELKREVDSQKLWNGEKIPLKNFLCQGLRLMIAETNLILSGPEQWMELMETQMMTDGYTDFRAYQEAVYVLGLFELMKYQNGDNWHWFEGDFRDGEYLLEALRSRIPKEEQENYDCYRAGLLKELEKKRVDTMKRILEERDQRLEKGSQAKGGIPVLDYFQKKMGEMKEDEFARFVKGQFAKNAWDNNMEWNMKVNLRGEKITKIWDITELFVYGGKAAKERLFQYLSEEEQTIVMERWMAVFYPSTVEKLAERLAKMLYAAEPDWWRAGEEEKNGSFYRKTVIESLEKIMGRTVTTEEIGYPFL